jgi:cytochrome bd ubiquinol oxidase subunit I
MKVLLSRWQFGVTITYHFLFVPLTIGLALLVAIMQVLAYRRKDAVWERLTRFFGTLFLINFAMSRPPTWPSPWAVSSCFIPCSESST